MHGQGWVAASQLQPGDQLLSHDGQWTPVEEAYDTGEYETVYNLRIADFHTYFVGSEEWGFSVWAHNADLSYTFQSGKREGQTVKLGEERNFNFVKQSPETVAKLRADFKGAKKDWIKQIAVDEKAIGAMKAAGISDTGNRSHGGIARTGDFGYRCSWHGCTSTATT